MNIIPWGNKGRGRELQPYGGSMPMHQIRSDMDQLFDRFFDGTWFDAGDGPGAASNWMPALDMSETEKEITVRAELPGVDAKDLRVELVGKVLTLAGQKSEQREQKGETFYHSERRFGSFRREIELPAGTDAEKITAEHKAGVVTIRIPKTAPAQVKRISVKAD